MNSDVTIMIILAVAGFGIGLLLNPLITRMATDSKAANPLQPVRYWFLGAPEWIGLVVALLLSLVAVVLYIRFGLSIQFAYWTAMSALLIVVGAVDWKVRLIDVLVLLVATVIALVLAPFVGVGLKNALVGAIVGGIIFIFFFMLAQLLFPGPGVPFGMGDVFLAIFIGSLVGFTSMGTALFYGILLAGIAALIMMGLRQMGLTNELYMSYGTYLCFGVLVFLMLWGHTI